MQVLGLSWVGTRTRDLAATTRFFGEVLGLPRLPSEDHFAVFAVPGGATVEVFGPGSPYNQHLDHPVAGFRVADLEQAQRELEAAGAEIVLPVQGDVDRRWLHFRAPDGFVYELSYASDAAGPSGS